jgi:molybdate transport system ATP-binding protein
MSIDINLRLSRKHFELQVDGKYPDVGITALFGPSGAGKTTLLRCLAGLERVAGAQMRFNDEIWQDAKHFVPAHRRRIGYVFQEGSLFPHLTTRGNLEYALRRVPVAQRRVQLDEVVTFLGLSDLLDRRSNQMSGGQLQRIAIARALLTSPQLLLMDEPLSSLDTASRNELLPHLERMHDELSIPIVYVTHNIEEVMRIADHLALLNAGRITAFGAAHELLTRPDLPLIHLDQAGSILDGVVAQHDTQFHLSYVDVPGGRLALSLKTAPVGKAVRVRIEARDVSLALRPPQQTSITNILPGRVLDVTADRDPAQRLVRVDVGGRVLLARITQRSASQLAIEPGLPLYLQIKSVALMN